jgi:4-hydroxy-tetrahydrodipicolinate synthase
MINERTKGVFIISVTPFTEHGEIDYPSVDSLVEFYVEAGVHGLTILGMMGEAQKLTHNEAAQLTKHILRRVDGRVPLIVGVSNSAIVNIKNLARAAMDEGAAGVLVAPIAGLRTDDQIFNYYALVCESLGPEIPVVYQDYPYSTGVHLSVPTFRKLIQAFPQVVMLKHEDCPGLGKISRIREGEAREGVRRTSILVGNGGLYYPLELRRGADGAMTGFAYPEMLVAVYDRFASGDPDWGEELFNRYLPLVRYEQQPGFGLAVRKEILQRRGAIATAKARLPAATLGPDDVADIDRLMHNLEG